MSRAGIFVALLLAGFLLIAGCSGQQDRALKIGDPAPDFTATDIQGRRIALADWQGKPVVIRFFYPECKYCKADTRVFNEYYQQYHGQGLEIVYINTRPGTAAMDEFVAELGIQFPVIEDTDGRLAASYLVKVVPQAVILAPDHRISAAVMGGVSGEELKELLGKYFR